MKLLCDVYMAEYTFYSAMYTYFMRVCRFFLNIFFVVVAFSIYRNIAFIVISHEVDFPHTSTQCKPIIIKINST